MSSNGDSIRRDIENEQVRLESNQKEAADRQASDDPEVVASAASFQDAAQLNQSTIASLTEQANAADQADRDQLQAELKKSERHKHEAERLLIEESITNL